MTPLRRGAAAALGLAGGLLAFGELPTEAQAGPAWSIVFDTAPGAVFDGDEILIAGSVRPPSGSVLTDLELTLARVEGPEDDPDDRCPDLVVNQHVRDGDDDASTSTTSTTAPPAPDGERFELIAVPACNGRYHVSLVATADRPGPEGIPDNRSDPATLGNGVDPADAIAADLRPGDVDSTTVTVDRSRTVSVDWTPPATVPPDLTGYVVQRALDGADFAELAASDPATLSHADALGAEATPGTYHYRVLAVRQATAPGQSVTSEGGATSTAQITIEAPPTDPPPTTRPVRAAPPVRRLPAPPTVQATVPPTTIDDEFSETLDYSDAEPGVDAAELPDGAESFLDFVPSPGAGILVPFAIAECLAVWAMHLRYLARRIDQR